MREFKPEIGKQYYSNCFIEAIKAKFKQGNRVKLIRKPARGNGQTLSHWLWLDKESNTVYDFHSLKDVKHIYQCIWFKGCVRATKIGGK